MVSFSNISQRCKTNQRPAAAHVVTYYNKHLLFSSSRLHRHESFSPPAVFHNCFWNYGSYEELGFCHVQAELLFTFSVQLQVTQAFISCTEACELLRFICEGLLRESSFNLSLRVGRLLALSVHPRWVHHCKECCRLLLKTSPLFLFIAFFRRAGDDDQRNEVSLNRLRL